MKTVKVAVALVLNAATAAHAEELVVQSRQKFQEQWKQSGRPGLSHLEISGRRQPLYGCVNVGVIVETDGTVSGPARLLLYRFDRPLPPGPNILGVLAGVAPRALPAFVPRDARVLPQTTFTGLSIAVRSDKLAKLLRGRDEAGLDAALRAACEVDDVLARVKSKDARPEEGPVLPDLDTLAPRVSD